MTCPSGQNPGPFWNIKGAEWEHRVYKFWEIENFLGKTTFGMLEGVCVGVCVCVHECVCVCVFMYVGVYERVRGKSMCEYVPVTY